MHQIIIIFYDAHIMALEGLTIFIILQSRYIYVCALNDLFWRYLKSHINKFTTINVIAKCSLISASYYVICTDAFTL